MGSSTVVVLRLGQTCYEVWKYVAHLKEIKYFPFSAIFQIFSATSATGLSLTGWMTGDHCFKSQQQSKICAIFFFLCFSNFKFVQFSSFHCFSVLQVSTTIENLCNFLSFCVAHFFYQTVHEKTSGFKHSNYGEQIYGME